MRTLAVCLLPLSLVWAQHHPAASETPVNLYPGLGAWHHAISTRSPEAQKYFDQGLALVYAFNRHEAVRSFAKAAELDPSAAMAYWGTAMALGPYINMDIDPDLDLKAACAAVEKGLAIAGTPERERAYLQALARRCPEYQPEAYAAAMRDLVARWPDDLDALTFYAESLMIRTRWHWYSASGAPVAAMPEAERALEEVLRRWPDHAGANHLYIHAVESSPTPERAVASAQRLMGIMPAAGHIVHMPAHIWLVLGDWELAASVNERAAAVDREYFARTRAQSGYGGYFVHNLHFVAYARWMQGRKADGLRAADTMAAAITPMAKAMPEMADAFLSLTAFARVRFSDWDGILKLAQPDAAMPASTIIWHYARALALAGRGDRAGAAREQAAFEAMRAQTPKDAPWGNNKVADVLALASEIVAARLAPDPAAAVPHLERAVAMQDALAYDEPPAWYYPVRESLGAALVRAGRAAEAETVLRDGVRRSPRNGRMLFALMEALQAQHKSEEASWVKREFDAAWSKADVRLQLAEL